jgi:hypothetical protein
LGDGIEARLDRHDRKDQQRVETDTPAFAVGCADELTRRFLRYAIAPGNRARNRGNILFGQDSTR